MTDKLSSPSASSGNSTGKSPTSRSSGNGNGDDPYLAIHRQPPPFLYSNESFSVELLLEVPRTDSPKARGLRELEVIASLHHAKTGRACGAEALLITEPSRIILGGQESDTRRPCKVTCIIRMDGIRRDQGAAVEIRFSARIDASPPARFVQGVATNTIQMVNYKIRISMEEEWGSVWYKDEGGRDKSMEVFAAVYDRDGLQRTGEQIPLQAILCYDTEGNIPVRVSNQEILRTLGATKIVIDKESGRARVRFRVEDVSKNHQAQDFVLEVGTDPKVKGYKDVAPAYTPAVNVRSKRNKRSRSQSTTRSTSAGEKRSSPVGGRTRVALYDDPQELAFDATDAPRLREAMNGVINWADEVVNGLYPLQWQVLGYAQHPDGSPDYNRPYHNMPNPNPCINRILSQYSDSIRESLRVLLNAVEQTGARSDDPSFIPSTASIPREPDDPYAMMRSPQLHGQAGMPHQAIPRRPGVHPSAAQDAFRDKPQQAPPIYQARGTLPQQMHPPPPMHPYNVRPHESEMMPMHAMLPPRREGPPMGGSAEVPMQRSVRQDEESRESEVEYVLAKQYKALRTGERLGFPAYSVNKEILGFYRESSSKVGVGQFTAISRHRNEFGPLEIMQATEILEEAVSKKSDAVHTLKEWGSIANLLDHALVYDWSKDIGNDPTPPSGSD